MLYRTGFSLHRAVDGAFASWTLEGCRLRDGFLVLDPARATRNSDNSSVSGMDAAPYYSGGEYLVGEATSPELASSFPFSACVPSWNAELPGGTWLEFLLRAHSGSGWTSWRSMGVWAPDDSTVKRHSVQGQDDEAARVSTDTLELSVQADAWQAKLRLFTAIAADGTPIHSSVPRLKAFSVAFSDPKPASGSVEASTTGRLKGVVVPSVPRCSQMVYPDGGKVWCSPTSVAMVLGRWRGDSGPCESRIRAAVAGVYDHVYDGYGNWSFNVAYAGSPPAGPEMEAYVARFSGLDRLEPWIWAGVPVVMSVSWNEGDGRPLKGAPVPRSAGHLTTLVGFDGECNPVMNEPASPSDETVRRTYDRSQLEARWLSASGGAAYIIYPAGAGDGDLARLFASTI